MKVHVIAFIGVMLIMGLLGAMPAMAGPITLTNGGPSIILSFQTSNPAVSGTAAFTLSGTNLTIVLQNTSSVPAGEGVITAIGWDTSPDTVIDVPSSTIPSPWDFGNGGMGGFEQAIGVSGIGDGLDPGASITFLLALTAYAGSIDLDTTALHVQNVPPTGGSEKPFGVPVPDRFRSRLLWF